MTIINVTARRLKKYGVRASYLPIFLFGRPVREPLLIVSAANDPYFLSIRQFLRSFFKCESSSQLIVYDLGLSPAHADELRAEFSGLNLRRFPFEEHPPFMNANINGGQYAWKPVIMATLLQEFGLPTIWMDSANVIRKRLDLLRRILGTVGFYCPHAKGTIVEWTHPGMLEHLKVEPTLYGKQNLASGCVAVNPKCAVAVELIRQWRDFAMIRECIAPDGADRSNHRQDQALLTVLAYRMGLAQRVYPYRLGYDFHRGPDRTCRQ